MTADNDWGWGDKDREEWQKSYRDLLTLLESFGKNEAFGEGDFWLMDEDWGNGEHRIDLDNLELLGMNFVSALQDVLREHYPNWIISVTVMPPKGAEWPRMGLLIGKDYVKDHLRREFLPPTVANLEF